MWTWWWWWVGCDDLWWRRQQLPEVDGPSKSFLLPQHLSVPVLFFLLQSGLLILTNPDFLKVKTKETNKLYRHAKSAKKHTLTMPFPRAKVFITHKLWVTIHPFLITNWEILTLNHIVTFSYLLQTPFSRLSAFLSELTGEEGYFLLAYKSQFFALQMFLGQHLLPKLQNSPNAWKSEYVLCWAHALWNRKCASICVSIRSSNICI